MINFNFNPGTLYISNQDGSYTEFGEIKDVEIETSETTTYDADETIDIANIEAAFECVAKISRDILMAITGVSDIVVKCCPNRKVAYLATHSRKKRTRKKNFHRAIKILEELAEVNND